MAEPKTTTAKTQPKDKNAMALHREDLFHLVIGFEVNNPVYRETPLDDGVTRKVHYVMEDPGHTFMYLTKNRKIRFFYSLGPVYSTDAQRAYGLGTPEYKIPGVTRLFRFNLNEAQYEKMLAKGKEYRSEVLAGNRYYNILNNFTCARSARDIIAAGWPNVPPGASPVGIPFVTKFDVVNPYAFYEDIHNKYPNGEIRLEHNKVEWKNLMHDSNAYPGKKADPTLNPSEWPKENGNEG